MRWFGPPSRGALLTAIALAVLPAPAAAQARCRPLCAPVVVLQPGIIAEDVSGDASPETDLNVRIVTAIPTFITRTRLVLGVQWPPFREIEDVTVNSPTLLYGPVLTLLNTRSFALELNALGEFGPVTSAEEAAERRYSHELLVQADGLLKAGVLWTEIDSRWRDLGIYGMVGYRATWSEEEGSPWVVLTGVSIPITP